MAAIILTLGFVNGAAASEERTVGTGLKPLTSEESKKLEKKKIKRVHLNKIGLKRVNAERKQKNLPDLPDSEASENEIEHEDGGATANTAISTTAATGAIGTAPAQVDNSTLVSFPKIGDQGSEGSCVAWASTYYQMSHEVCLTLGCDNKNSSAKVFSPKWTYNMINGGVDGGSFFSDAFNLVAAHGAPMLSEFPYVSGDYRSWDLNSEHWRSAINSRMSSYSSLSVNSDAGMANAKVLLSNGHVLVIGTYIYSWQFRTVQANPNSRSNPFVGQAIATYINGQNGGHAMTIVGYDDNIWTDINGNGLVEPSELGAFKIANSWGTGWKNGGYVWIAYDSLRSSSSVPGFAPAGRVQLAQSGAVYTMTFAPYAPKLLAKVTVSHAARNQMALRFGSSSTSATTAQATWTPVALTSDGGAYAFNGTSSEVEGTFYFDISSLQTTALNQSLFYLMATDNSSGQPLTVKAFQLIDPAVNTTLNAAANVPLLADANTQTLKIGVAALVVPAPQPTPVEPAPIVIVPPPVVTDTQAPSVPAQLTASVVNTQKRNGRITFSINLNWQASTDSSGVAKYMIYRNGIKLAETTSTNYSDSSGRAGVNYTYQVSAVDTKGNVSAKSNSVTVKK